MRAAIVLILLSAVISCRSSDKTQNAKQTTWPTQMQGMAHDVKRLVPYIYNRQAYQDPKNRETIRKALADFASVSHAINPQSGKPFLGDDLLLEYSLQNLKDDLNRAVHGFDIGQFEYSRSVAKSSLNHCFRCHSVTQAGASASWDLGEIQQLNLAPVEKADLLVATRKYDEAMSYMESLLKSDDFLSNYAFDFESILRRYLALMIRVENDPKRALAGLDRVLENPRAPRYIVEQAEGWRQSLREWSKEKKQPIKSSAQMFQQVDRRFKRAEAIQRYEKDHAGDVEYLRATSILHEGLKLTKDPVEQARAFYLLGNAYEVLDELGSWNLHESYYEACLMKAPKTPQARKCFNRLEASLYMGYSGSSGTHMPPEEKARLEKLRQQL